jgi:site-specific DNA-methyltransferase (adenine-specific)
MKSEFLNIDCMEFMKDIPDKYFDLAICDPPYGISINMNQGRRQGQNIKHQKKQWDSSAPDKTYFISLCRVSKNQIIWGENNFSWIPASNGRIIWDKDITGNVSFSMAEIAYCSLLNHIEIIRIRAQTGLETYSNKIHPTQKPIKLYRWLLQNYAKPGDKIFDSHVGSASSLIACHLEGFEYVGCEKDYDYWKEANERLEQYKAQGSLF